MYQNHISCFFCFFFESLDVNQYPHEVIAEDIPKDHNTRSNIVLYDAHHNDYRQEYLGVFCFARDYRQSHCFPPIVQQPLMLKEYYKLLVKPTLDLMRILQLCRVGISFRVPKTLL